MIDITKNAQVQLFQNPGYQKINHIRSYRPKPNVRKEYIEQAAQLINQAKKPFVIFGQGIILGSAEAEFKAFIEKELTCYGIDLSPSRIEAAKHFQQEAFGLGKLKFLSKNIYDIQLKYDLDGPFDIILLKDVIEHIPKQENFIQQLASFLNPGGVIFFGFPPWQMPFGGHQQMAKSKLLSKLPWFHLLPKSIYKKILSWGGQDPITLNEFMEIKDTGISIERFERIVKQNQFQILNRKMLIKKNDIRACHYD